MEEIHGYWSGFLGVAPGALEEPGVRVVPHAVLAGYHGVWFFVRGDSAVVSVPAARVEEVRRRVAGRAPGSLLEPEVAGEVLGGEGARVIGPSYQGWLPAGGLRFEGSSRVRRGVGAAELEDFREACGEADWGAGGVDPAKGEAWGAWDEGELLAVGQMRARPEGPVDPGVVTLSAARGKGLGRDLVGAMSAAAQEEGRLVLYQTLLGNRAAVALAEGLGFGEYARLLAVRLG